MTDKPQEWNEAFDKKFFTPEEIAASDARISVIKKEIGREMVINGLWCCTHPGNCGKCEFDISRDDSCLQSLLEAAHDLLKAQEPEHGEWKWAHGGECSVCGFHNSNFDYRFCPMCGAVMDRR